jgi:hypothetical protein
MIPSKQNGAADLAHPVRETDQAAQQVCREYRETKAPAQYRLIAIVAKTAREQYRIGIGTFNGVAKCELRVYALDGQGNWKPTPKLVIIPGGSLAGITEAFCEVEQRL